MERAVLDQLADYFKTRLAGYPTTVAEDESLVLVCQNQYKVEYIILWLSKYVLIICILY